MPKVYILCGKIASGKTTYAKSLKEKNKAMILSCDDLMLTLFDGCLGEKHNDIVDRCSRFFNNQAEELISIGIDAVLDFGYWTKLERTKAKEYFIAKNIPVELHYLKIPENLRLERLIARNQSLSTSSKREYIIDDELRNYLDAKFEEPTADEIDKIITY